MVTVDSPPPGVGPTQPLRSRPPFLPSRPLSREPRASVLCHVARDCPHSGTWPIPACQPWPRPGATKTPGERVNLSSSLVLPRAPRENEGPATETGHRCDFCRLLSPHTHGMFRNHVCCNKSIFHPFTPALRNLTDGLSVFLPLLHAVLGF